MSHSGSEQARPGFETWLRGISTAGVIAGGVMLLAVSALVIVEITLRKFFETSIQGVDEISSYAMAVAFAWAMPFAILDRAHIRIDVIHAILPERMRAWFDLGSAIVFCLYMTILSYFALTLAWASYSDGTRSEGLLATPLVIPQSVWAVGLALSVPVLLYLIVAASRAVFAGDYDTARRLIGTESFTQDEVDQAVSVTDDGPGARA
ncbi:MAG TPA: TRAP transporter small permease [Pseudolabrys sp.]|nr:TRAP transporter small permease [Pseudolabrys sp.]